MQQAGFVAQSSVLSTQSLFALTHENELKEYFYEESDWPSNIIVSHAGGFGRYIGE
jgi:hypothetical protein